MASENERERADSSAPRRLGRRGFMHLGGASAALVAGAWAGRATAQGDTPADDLDQRLADRLEEFHDPRDHGAFWDGKSHPIGSTADSTRTHGPYSSVTDARRDFPVVTDLANEWDWVGLVTASTAAGASGGAIHLPSGTGLIDSLWRPPSGTSVFGAGIGTTTLRLMGHGSVGLAELTKSYRHGYFGDLTIDASATTASPAVSIGLLAESVCGPVRVSGAPADGVVITNAQNSEFWSWQVVNCHGNGLIIDGGAMNLEFDNATVKFNGGSNVIIRRSDVEVPSQFSAVPRLIRFRGGISEGIQSDGSDCFRLTSGIDITFDGVQTSVGSGYPSSASVRLNRDPSHALQLIRLTAVQFKADDGIGLSVTGASTSDPIRVFISQANFRSGSSAIQSDDGALIHIASYFRASGVARLFSHLGGAKDVDQIVVLDSPLILNASRASPTLGTPRLVNIVGHPVWSLDAGEEVGVSFVEFVPATWESFDVQLWWTRSGGDGAGDAAWRLSHLFQAGAPSTRDLEDSPVVGAALPTDGELAITTLATNLTKAGGIYTFRVTRVPGDVRDTTQDSVSIYALVLRRS